jgi:hypothetical protein
MTDLGVVDPLRPPASVVAFGGRLRLLAPYAIGFLGIFLARGLADLYALLRQLGDIGAYPTFLSLILGSVPEWLALLLPVAVGRASVRGGVASSRVVRGAMAIGLSEVVAMAAGFIGGPENPTYAVTAIVRAASFVLLAGGLLWMAQGLEALRSGPPSAAGRRGALVALAFGVAVVAVQLFGRLAQILSFNYSDYADGGQDGAILIGNVLGLSYVLVPLGWAYLSWVLLRSGVDAGRPTGAIRFGSWTGWLALIWLGTSLAGLALLPFATQTALAAGEQTMLGTIAYVLAISAATLSLAAMATLVAGLASGLAAEPSRDAGPGVDAASGS